MTGHRTQGATDIDILVGRVGRAHGIKGEVTLDVRTDEPERRFAVGTSFATARGPLTISKSRWQGVRLVVSFAEVPDRNAAEALRGTELRIEVASDERPDDPEEFYDHQLVGLLAVEASGREIGGVTDVLHLPAQDVLVVDYAGREVLIPFVAAIVPEVDLAGSRVVVNPQPGLLDELDDSVEPAADSTEEANR